MTGLKRYLTEFILKFIPETRCFRLKRALYRFVGIKIGKNVRMCSSARFMGAGRIEIGCNTWVGHQVLIISSSYIRIGSDVDIAPNVYIGTGSHSIDPTGKRVAGIGYNKDIIIGDGSWLGVNACILPGVSVGQKCIIAAGAVVINDTESLSVYGGVPAKKIRSL